MLSWLSMLFAIGISLTTIVSSKVMTGGMRDNVLRVHNHHRRLITKGSVKNGRGEFLPKAGGMSEMYWDDDLALEASRRAQNCEMPSKKPWHQREDRVWGENIAWGPLEPEEMNVTRSAVAWFQEIYGNSPTDMGHFADNDTVCYFTTPRTRNPTKIIGNFVQFASDSLSRLGCGIQHCSSKEFEFPTVIVCKYANERRTHTTYRNAPIYYPGEPCEYCSGSCNDGLCTAPAQLPTVCDPNKAPGGRGENHVADNKSVVVVVQILKTINLAETTTASNKWNGNKGEETFKTESDNDDDEGDDYDDLFGAKWFLRNKVKLMNANVKAQDANAGIKVPVSVSIFRMVLMVFASYLLGRKM